MLQRRRPNTPESFHLQNHHTECPHVEFRLWTAWLVRGLSRIRVAGRLFLRPGLRAWQAVGLNMMKNPLQPDTMNNIFLSCF
jgi:hypothetical protein